MKTRNLRTGTDFLAPEARFSGAQTLLRLRAGYAPRERKTAGIPPTPHTQHPNPTPCFERKPPVLTVNLKKYRVVL
ncbi:MAG: hypothetical protein F6J93_04445 [Oscillatoria sp. SIO1A7]|nr:hypothetical protein [Oscillatoria sp. SIO1A7]